MSAVADHADELAALLILAGLLIVWQDRDDPAMISGGTVSVSSPDWNTPAAYAVTDAHAGVRRLESELRMTVTGTLIIRGGSDGNTRAALKMIAPLAEAADQEKEAARRLRQWIRACKLLRGVDVGIRWTAIRSKYGDCPYCDTPSLRAAEGYELVACGNPACQDDNGKPPVAHMEIGVTGEAILAWSDGRVSLPGLSMRPPRGWTRPSAAATCA